MCTVCRVITMFYSCVVILIRFNSFSLVVIESICPVAIGVRISYYCFFFFSSRRRHTRLQGDWSSDVCSSDLFRLLFRRPGWPVPRQLGLEIAQTRPVQPAIEIDFGYDNVAPLFGFRQPLASLDRKSVV